jgi:hypothetical protein
MTMNSKQKQELMAITEPAAAPTPQEPCYGEAGFCYIHRRLVRFCRKEGLEIREPFDKLRDVPAAQPVEGPREPTHSINCIHCPHVLQYHLSGVLEDTKRGCTQCDCPGFDPAPVEGPRCRSQCPGTVDGVCQKPKGHSGDHRWMHSGGDWGVTWFNAAPVEGVERVTDDRRNIALCSFCHERKPIVLVREDGKPRCIDCVDAHTCDRTAETIPITIEGLVKYWDGLEVVALRKYSETSDSKYLSEALTIRLHLRGLGTDPDTKHLHECRSRAETRIEVLEAALNAAARLLDKKYLPWERAHGPNECMHGIAAAIACRHCDDATVRAALAAPSGEKPKV